jgi:hypothetical protein
VSEEWLGVFWQADIGGVSTEWVLREVTRERGEARKLIAEAKRQACAAARWMVTSGRDTKYRNPLRWQRWCYGPVQITWQPPR